MINTYKIINVIYKRWAFKSVTIFPNKRVSDPLPHPHPTPKKRK